MLRFLADEDLNEAFTHGIRTRGSIDWRTVREVGLGGMDDPAILEWASSQSRIVVTHDVNTMTAAGKQRIMAGLYTPGVVVIHQDDPVGPILQELLIVAHCGDAEDFENQICFLPL
ncbi:MAG: DUF5615 family PIN-like protein [Phycisphaeraceae bacterium]